MKIRKSSWHYRLVMWQFGSAPNNLCCYFWVVVFGIVFLTVKTTFILLASILMLYLTCLHYKSLLIFLGGIVFLAVLWWILSTLFYRKPKEPKTFFGKWIKAKKEKVCPMIEFVDE